MTAQRRTLDYIPALSLTRPWTSFIFYSGKSPENRIWQRDYRGPLILHSAQSWDPYAAQFFQKVNAVAPPELDPAKKDDHPLGYIGVVQLVDIHPAGDPERCNCEWGFPKQFHWMVEDPLAFPEPIPGKGRQQLFRPPIEVQDHARALIEGRPYVPTSAPTKAVDPYSNFLVGMP